MSTGGIPSVGGHPRAAIVVGGGVFGLGAAISLAERGWRVTVLERYDVPSQWGSSTDTSRMVRMDYGDDELYFHLARKALLVFRQWNAELVAQGQRPLLNESGLLFVRKGAIDEPGAYEGASRSVLIKHDVPHERYNGRGGNKTLAQRFPGWSRGDALTYIDGYWNKEGGWADSGRTVEFMAAKARKLGVQLVCGERTGRFASFIDALDGAVLGVRTADGREHRADVVLMAAGPWTPSLVPELDGLISVVGQPVVYVKVPDGLASVYQSSNFPAFGADIARTGWYGFPCEPATGNLLKLGSHGNGFVSRSRMPDGRLCTVPVPGATPPPHQIAVMRRFIDTTWPDLRDAPIVRTRLCYYCDTWDANFYISAVPGRPNLFVSTGGSGHGFKFAPVLGDIAADCIEGRPNAIGERFKWRTPPIGARQQAEQCRKKDDAPEELVHTDTQQAHL